MDALVIVVFLVLLLAVLGVGLLTVQLRRRRGGVLGTGRNK